MAFPIEDAAGIARRFEPGEEPSLIRLCADARRAPGWIRMICLAPVPREISALTSLMGQCRRDPRSERDRVSSTNVSIAIEKGGGPWSRARTRGCRVKPCRQPCRQQRLHLSNWSHITDAFFDILGPLPMPRFPRRLGFRPRNHPRARLPPPGSDAGFLSLVGPPTTQTPPPLGGALLFRGLAHLSGSIISKIRR